MKRWAAMAAALLIAAACGNDSPTTASGPTGPIVFTANVSAANEAPPITNAEANALGTVTITVTVPRDATTGAVTGAGTVSFVAQLASFPARTPAIMAHIHTGIVGVVGGVLVDTRLAPANPVLMDANGSGTINVSNIDISQATATSIVANPAGFYFDVHTTLNPTGAVRGQLVAKQ